MRIIIKPGGIAVLSAMLTIAAVMGLQLTKRDKASATEKAVPGSVALYTFEEGKGKTVADTTGHGHDLTLQGEAEWTDGYVGKSALNLNGKDQYGEFAQPLVDTTKSYTVTACIRLNDLNWYETFVSIDGEKVSGFYLQLRGDNHRLSFAVLPNDDDSKNTPAIAASHELPVAGRWYHLTGVYNAEAKTVSLYVNGKLHQTTPCNSVWQAKGPTAIGRGKYGTPKDFVNGQIDQVAFYQKALSDNEIEALAKTSLPAGATEKQPDAQSAP